MGIATTLAKNVFSSWMGFSVQVITTLLLTPCIIENLGLEAYGIWLFLGSAVGYYGLIDMGLRSGITQSITRQVASRDIEGIRRRLGTYNPTMAIVGGGVVCIALLAWAVIPKLLTISPAESKNLTLVVFVQAIGLGYAIATVPYAALLVGLERYDISEGCSVISKLFSSFFIYFTVTWGWGLLGLAFGYTLAALLDSTMRVLFARSLLPGVKGVNWSINKEDITNLIRNSYLNTIILLSRQLIHFSSSIIVGILFNAAAIPAYSIAASFVEYATKLIMLSTRVLFPTMVAVDESGDKNKLINLYKISSRLSIGLSLSLLIPGIVWMKPFLILWLGNGKNSSVLTDLAPSLFAILGSSTVAVAAQRSGSQLLLAKDAVTVLARLMIIEAITTVLFSLLLGFYFGLKGVAIGTLIPCFFFSFCVYIPKHAESLGTSSIDLLSSVLPRPLMYGLLLVLLIKTFEWYCPKIDNWFSFFAIAGGSSCIFSFCLIPILFTNREFGGLRSSLVSHCARFRRRFVS
jgi:O-antigen/teichoic acid export membrane protein